MATDVLSWLTIRQLVVVFSTQPTRPNRALPVCVKTTFMVVARYEGLWIA
ncbi:MAG: hypothetical protein ABI602_05080 [Candidatus Saccharibacteria bacterium]